MTPSNTNEEEISTASGESSQLQYMSQLRALYRALSEAKRPSSRLKWFIGKVVSSISAVFLLMRYGLIARVSILWQMYSLLILIWRYNFRAFEYYMYRLYKVKSVNEALFYVSGMLHIDLQRHLYAKLGLDASRIGNKKLLLRRCQDDGLPVTPTLAYFEAGQIHWWNDGQRVGLPQRDLFCKPFDQNAGTGAALWKCCGEDRYQSSDGQVFRSDQLIEYYKEQSRFQPYLMQKRSFNHPEISAIGSEALCTVRIVTYIEPDREPKFMVATFRMASGSKTVDNFRSGGIASPVDELTGRLGIAVTRNPRRLLDDFPSHPVTGKTIAGVCLPHWQEAKSLCLKAHKLFAAYPSIGWDVAITPEGPIIVEANEFWGFSLVQHPGNRPLGKTVFPKWYLSYLRYAENHGVDCSGE